MCSGTVVPFFVLHASVRWLIVGRLFLQLSRVLAALIPNTLFIHQLFRSVNFFADICFIAVSINVFQRLDDSK